MFVALLLAALGLSSAQTASSGVIDSLQYNGHTYYVISENTSLLPFSLPTSVPSPTRAADELPFGPTSEADFPRVSAPPDAGCEEFLTTRELCA